MKKIIALALMATAVNVYAKTTVVTIPDMKAEPRWRIMSPFDALVFPVVYDPNGYPVHNFVTVRVDRFAPDGFNTADPLVVFCSAQSFIVAATQSITCDTAYGMKMQIAMGAFRSGSEGTYFYNGIKKKA